MRSTGGCAKDIHLVMHIGEKVWAGNVDIR